MRTRYSFLAAVVVVFISVPSRAAKMPRPAQGNQNQAKRVWTNEDMDQLRARGLISIVGQETQAAASPAVASSEPSAPTAPAYNSRLDDPTWYVKQAADLQAELDKREAALREEHAAIEQASNRITQPGIAMDKPTIGVTPQAALTILEAQVNEVQSQIDALSDLARENNISPGLLRAEATAPPVQTQADAS